MTREQTSSHVACGVCGRTTDVAVTAPPFAGVTSDSKPWPRLAPICVCSCGMVRKQQTDDWRRDVEAIYRNYTLYHFSQETDQVVRDASTSNLMPRTQIFLEFLLRSRAVPERGSLLDVGCGNGAVLHAAAQRMPAWRLYGFEPSTKTEQMIRAIPGVSGFFAGLLDEVPGRHDLVTMMHVLEHVDWPAEVLERVANKLASNGLLAIGVPNYLQNPFDLMVADHAFHFSSASLQALLLRSGFSVVASSDRCLPKELVIVARKAKGPMSPVEPNADALQETVQSVTDAFRWLSSLVDYAVSLSHDGQPVGVFGTAIAGTWVFTQRRGVFTFFVDENERCVGKRYFGLPVFRPADVPAGSRVLVAQPPALAAELVARLHRINPTCRWEVGAMKAHHAVTHVL